MNIDYARQLSVQRIQRRRFVRRWIRRLWYLLGYILATGLAVWWLL